MASRVQPWLVEAVLHSLYELPNRVKDLLQDVDITAQSLCDAKLAVSLVSPAKQAACLEKFALCDAALSPQPGTAYSGTSQHPTAGLFTEEIAGTFEVVFIPDRVQTPDSMK